MRVRGKIKNGKVILDDPKELAEGTEVEVRSAKVRKSSAKPPKPKGKDLRRTLAERLANVIGEAKGLPPDASVNHDHYLYGTPKHFEQAGFRALLREKLTGQGN